MKDYIEGTIMRDTVETTSNGSVLQHGKHNDRIYLMKLSEHDVPGIFNTLTNLAIDNGYAKVFCKVPKNIMPLFIAQGFIQEAHIPGFFNGEEDACFMSKFTNSDRLLHLEKPELESFSLLLNNKHQISTFEFIKASAFKVRQLSKEDVGKITELYRTVFLTYPFPIHNPGYILKTMEDNMQYYGIEKNNQLIAIASAEIDSKERNAEMTDFATHPDYKGKRLASIILYTMEQNMKKQGIKTLFTIARLASAPMNKTFIRFGYNYTGTLVKNTNISGNIESMNIYYKII